MPPERNDALSRNVYVRVGLVGVRAAAVARGRGTHLYRVQDLDDARVAQGAQLLERVLGQGQAALVGGDVEGKDAAVGAVLLAGVSRVSSRGAAVGACPPGAVVQGPDGFVDVDLVAKGVGEGRPLGNGRGHGGLEEVHGRWPRREDERNRGRGRIEGAAADRLGQRRHEASALGGDFRQYVSVRLAGHVAVGGAGRTRGPPMSTTIARTGT